METFTFAAHVYQNTMDNNALAAMQPRFWDSDLRSHLISLILCFSALYIAF